MEGKEIVILKKIKINEGASICEWEDTLIRDAELNDRQEELLYDDFGLEMSTLRSKKIWNQEPEKGKESGERMTFKERILTEMMGETELEKVTRGLITERPDWNTKEKREEIAYHYKQIKWRDGQEFKKHQREAKKIAKEIKTAKQEKDKNGK